MNMTFAWELLESPGFGPLCPDSGWDSQLQERFREWLHNHPHCTEVEFMDLLAAMRRQRNTFVNKEGQRLSRWTMNKADRAQREQQHQERRLRSASGQQQQPQPQPQQHSSGSWNSGSWRGWSDRSSHAAWHTGQQDWNPKATGWLPRWSGGEQGSRRARSRSRGEGAASHSAWTTYRPSLTGHLRAAAPSPQRAPRSCLLADGAAAAPAGAEAGRPTQSHEAAHGAT